MISARSGCFVCLFKEGRRKRGSLLCMTYFGYVV